MRFLLFFILSGLVVPLTLLGGRDSDSQRRAKSRYYYMQGVLATVDDDYDAAYEFYKKAWLTDSTNPDASMAYGYQRLVARSDSLRTIPELDRSVAMLRMYTDSFPGDIYENMVYATYARHLGVGDEAVRIMERSDSLFPSKTSILLELSDIYAERGRIDDALDALRRYRRQEGASPGLAMKMVSLQFQGGDSIGAMKTITDEIREHPREPVYLIIRSNLYSAMNDSAGELDDLLHAEKVNPTAGAPKFALAGYYREKGDSVNFDLKTYEALLSEDFGFDEKKELLTDYLQTILADSADTSRGDHLFEVVLGQFPHEPELLDLSARFSAATGNQDKAIEQISYAIDLNGDNPAYWAQLMSYQISDDRYEDAMKTYVRAGKYIDNTSSLDILYASAATLNGEPLMAIEVYQRMIDEELPGASLSDSLLDPVKTRHLPEDRRRMLSSIFSMAGDAYYSAKEREKAYSAYRKSLELYPDNILSLNNYAYFLSEEERDLEKALEMSSKAVEGDPENPTYLDTYAWILYKLGRYQEALEYQRKAIRKVNDSGEELSEELKEHLKAIETRLNETKQKK